MAVFEVRSFDEFTTRELYEIMRARSDVFVGEEHILYPDADGLDYVSTHVFSWGDEGRIASYLRMYPKPGEPGVYQMGRVLTAEHGRGLGKALLKKALEVAKMRLGANEIYVESQKHAEGFYLKAGFRTTSDDFIEAGIPHVEMRKRV